jgi:hypothetical protein
MFCGKILHVLELVGEHGGLAGVRLGGGVVRWERHTDKLIETAGAEAESIRSTDVLRVNTKDLETTSWVGNTNVDFTIESAEPSQCGIDGAGSVGSRHDKDV